jgi:hypothetical protein
VFILSGRFKSIDSLSKKTQLILVLIIGLILGTVFVFGCSYWNSEVSRTECIQSNPIYESHKLNYRRARLQEIIIYFSNEEIMTIDGVSIDDELIEEIEKLDEQSKIIILYHPNSNTVMEMVVNGKELLDFDTTMTKMVNERNGFIFIGCVMYLFVFLSVIELIKIRKKK